MQLSRFSVFLNYFRFSTMVKVSNRKSRREDSRESSEAPSRKLFQSMHRRTPSADPESPLPTFSPTSLARRLVELRDQLGDVEGIKDAVMELQGFDVKEAGSLEEFEILRDAVATKTGVSLDGDTRTEINCDAAAIAGAKMVIDSERCSRSLSKRLAATSGISEKDILYKGLTRNGPEFKQAKAIADKRKASLIESLVDFQKQIQFKMNVLKHLEDSKARKAPKELSKSDTRITRGRIQKTAKKAREQAKTRPKVSAATLRTPSQKGTINPLDDKRIYDNYAHEIASEVRDNKNKNKERRRTAPIPFNLGLLDDDENEATEVEV